MGAAPIECFRAYLCNVIKSNAFMNVELSNDNLDDLGQAFASKNVKLAGHFQNGIAVKTHVRDGVVVFSRYADTLDGRITLNLGKGRVRVYSFSKLDPDALVDAVLEVDANRKGDEMNQAKPVY